MVSALGSTQVPPGSSDTPSSLTWSPASSAKAKPTQPSDVSEASMLVMIVLSSADDS